MTACQKKGQGGLQPRGRQQHKESVDSESSTQAEAKGADTGNHNGREIKTKGLQQWEWDWTYVGHGEWSPPEDHHCRAEIQHTPLKQSQMEKEPGWVSKWLAEHDEDIKLHQEVLRDGYPNRWGVRRPVKTKWNLDRLRELLGNYHDKEVVEWITYGWPTGRLPTLPDPGISMRNHKGAVEHPQALAKYIVKEQGQGAVMGPYRKIPFQQKVGVSPLSTRPKKDSAERRVILDLSFPVGNSVNDGILKDNYMGLPAKLTFPRVDDFALRIYQLGKGCMMFKVDLSRYFRQLPLDPGDYSLLGYVINGKLYFDKVLPMGMRSAPYIAQRVTNAIAHIIHQLEFFLLNYVDDFVGAELKERIWDAYRALTMLLEELRVDTSEEKMVPPTTRLEFLGITFDSSQMTMEISQQKMEEINSELRTWLYRTKARRREVESLIGKLQFMAKCVKVGRIFLARLIQWIRGMDRHSEYSIPMEAKKDITWWGRCAQQFNGISLIWLHKYPVVDNVVVTDACLIGYGGTYKEQYFRGRFPEKLKGCNIALLEILAVMCALKLWAKHLEGQYFWIHVDNEAVATVLNTGACRDVALQNVLRGIALLAAKHQFVVKARHISGVSNRIPDWLSRWHEEEARKQFREHAKDNSLKQIKVACGLLDLTNNW